MKKFQCLFILMALPLMVRGNSHWKSKIDSVTKSGFYKVILSPEMIGLSQESLNDVRIYDSFHKEVPYVLQEEKGSHNREVFKNYEILETKYYNTYTKVVIHNPSKNIISSFVFIIRNADVAKEITLKGSEDQNNWFIIKQNYLVRSVGYNGETSEMRVLDFPNSNYQYFSLIMSDKKKDPIQILKIGYYETETISGDYTLLPTPVITQKENITFKQSLITIQFKQPFEICKLIFEIKGPEFYKRKGVLNQPVYQNGKHIDHLIAIYSISSGAIPVVEFNKIKTDDLKLIIDNENNQPLTITGVKAYQLDKYAIAYLKSGESYELFFGDSLVQKPSYDLEYFSDSLNRIYATIKTGKIESIQSIPTQKRNFFPNKVLLWIVILIVIILLGWCSIRLIKEIDLRR